MNRMARAAMAVTVAVMTIGWESRRPVQFEGPVGSSLLLLIDISGSMDDPVGAGNPAIKIVAAKEAAIAALGRATQSGSVEVAVLAFSGDCQNPVPLYQDFTRDVNALTGFIRNLLPGGGTPMAPAVLFANRFMEQNGDPGAPTRMIMLLADGQNDCGDVDQAMETLQASGVIFRHETVGFGIAPGSSAAQDLRQIATRTGGVYHHAVDANQLADVFMEFVDTFTVIDMLGRFGGRRSPAPAVGGGGPAPPSPAPAASAPDTPASAPAASAPGTPASGRLTDMFGQFRPGSSASAATEPEAAGASLPASASGLGLCYRRFSNGTGGLSAVQDGYSVTEFTCAPSCSSVTPSFYAAGEVRMWQLQQLQDATCAAQCAAAAAGTVLLMEQSTYENHCVNVMDSLQQPREIAHYYCDISDNKHGVTWESDSQPTGAFQIYLNHFPENDYDAQFMGKTQALSFDFEYGISFLDTPDMDGMNRWDPFPQVGVSACNKYGVCTPVVYGDLADCEP